MALMLPVEILCLCVLDHLGMKIDDQTSWTGYHHQRQQQRTRYDLDLATFRNEIQVYWSIPLRVLNLVEVVLVSPPPLHPDLALDGAEPALWFSLKRKQMR